MPDGDDLRQLAGDTESTSTSLEETHGLHVDDGGVEERVGGGSQASDESSGSSTLAAVLQDQSCNGDVLDGNEGRLAICAEGEAHASTVCERDEV